MSSVPSSQGKIYGWTFMRGSYSMVWNYSIHTIRIYLGFTSTQKQVSVCMFGHSKQIILKYYVTGMNKNFSKVPQNMPDFRDF